MNCKIEPMNDARRKNIDTLPPRGRVNEVRREWLVHEDGALAHRLQDEEIQQHLTGNRSRNCQIREDFPTARNEQEREVEEAARLHQQLVQQQEEEDARVAAQLAERIQREEIARKRQLEEEDQELAKVLQIKEQQRIEKRERERQNLEQHTPNKERHGARPAFAGEVADEACGGLPVYTSNLADMNSVGLPTTDLTQSMRRCNLSVVYRREESPSPTPMSEEEARRLQEEKDAEFARYLQEQEDLENSDTTNRDRLLAIETQDKELARLLQEKERAKARRARLRARQKKEAAAAAAAAAASVSGGEDLDEGGPTIKTAETVSLSQRSQLDDLTYRSYSPSHAVRPTDLGLKPNSLRHKPRYPDPEEIVELPLSDPPSNIAMAIDPTYPRRRGSSPLDPTLSRRPHSSQSGHELVTDLDEVTPLPASHFENELVTDTTIPPYMPIQGQRRLPEKKTKSKDGCKQQ